MHIFNSILLYCVLLHVTQDQDQGDSAMPTQANANLRTVSLKTYYNFFRAGGSILFMAMTILMFILGEVLYLVRLLVGFGANGTLHVYDQIVINNDRKSWNTHTHTHTHTHRGIEI